MATNKATATKRTKKPTTKAIPLAQAKNRKRSTTSGQPNKAAAGSAKRDSKGGTEKASSDNSSSTRDPRLPQPGTVLRKIDRQGNVRCQCTIGPEGITYKGKTYRSISAAAVAAAADLGIKGSQNGFIFWGLSKPSRAGEDPIVRLQKSWDRYTACARSVVATVAPDRKPEVMAAIERFRRVEVLDA